MVGLEKRTRAAAIEASGVHAQALPFEPARSDCCYRLHGPAGGQHEERSTGLQAVQLRCRVAKQVRDCECGWLAMDRGGECGLAVSVLGKGSRTRSVSKEGNGEGDVCRRRCSSRIDGAEESMGSMLA